jgi:3-phosphoshikimate 1-carboxyvinyltransferase
MKRTIQPSKALSGSLRLPGDKSISHRAIMIGAIASGDTRARYILDCDDCRRTMDALRSMGVSIKTEKDDTVIMGGGLKGLKRPRAPIDVGESGTSMRLLSGVLSGQDFEAVLTGSGGLLKRPMRRIVEPLRRMGVDISAKDGEHPPLVIKGGSVKAISYDMPVPSAQIKSAVLLAGLYADGVTTVSERFKSREHTERMLKYFGADITVEGLNVSVKGGKTLSGRTFEIPADISSAVFFIAAATVVKGSRIKIENTGVNPTRLGAIEVLKRMGADIKVSGRIDAFEPAADIEVSYRETRGTMISDSEIPALIDELPVIFVVAALSKGVTIIKGAEELRVKETDRIASMKANLEAMGASMRVEGDEIKIEGAPSLKGAGLKSFGDHRTCMAASVAALAAHGESVIDDDACINKSFPRFFTTLERLYVK